MANAISDHSPNSGVFAIDLEKLAEITSSDLSSSLASDISDFTCDASQEDIALAAALFSQWHSTNKEERNLQQAIRYLCITPEIEAPQQSKKQFPPAAQFTRRPEWCGNPPKHAHVLSMFNDLSGGATEDIDDFTDIQLSLR